MGGGQSSIELNSRMRMGGAPPIPIESLSGPVYIGVNNYPDRYYTDRFNVYWRGTKIPEAIAMSFQDLGRGYGKDTFFSIL